MNTARSFFNILFLSKVALLVNIITWLIVYFKIRPTSEVIPLHYNIFYGADAIGKGYYIYAIPAIGLVIFFFNYFLYRRLAARDQVAAKIMIGVAFTVQILLLIAILFLRSIILF